jgi:aspartate kinase
MLRSAEVVVQQNSILVVVSATSGTTNDLIELGKTSQTKPWDQAEVLLRKIRTRHEKIAEDLKLTPALQEKLQGLLEETEAISRGVFLLKDCSVKAMDTLMSLGERLSSVLFCQALDQVLKKSSRPEKAQWLDVRTVLRTDDSYGKARPQTAQIAQLCEKNLAALLDGSVVLVTQGFVGATEDGMTTTLGRGGSDYSAAILAEAINADVVEIWTDVAGIATTDPRISPKAKPIAEISFKEASELATFGAKVLHPATLLPAIRKNIPVFVGSSFNAEAKGTWVRREVEGLPLVRALALRKQQILVTLSTPEMLQAHGFLFQIFKIFNDHKVSIDAITTAEISVSVTLDDSALSNKKLFSDLAEIAEVQVEQNLALVSLIGNSLNHTFGVGKQIFEALQDINVRMICLGASKHNFCFIVSEEQGPLAIQRLHAKFIENV